MTERGRETEAAATGAGTESRVTARETGARTETGKGEETESHGSETDRSDVSVRLLDFCLFMCLIIGILKRMFSSKYKFKDGIMEQFFFSLLSFPLSGSDSYPERRGVRKGNTVYVYGTGLVEDNLRSAFSQHGTIIDLSMDSPRKYGYITFMSLWVCDWESIQN